MELPVDSVKDREYEELFDKPVEQVKEDREKVKEALFQVHHIVWNEELYDLAYEEDDDRYYVSMPEIEQACTMEEYNRVLKQLQGATVSENDDGEVLVPKTDLKDVLSARKGLVD